MRSLPCSRLVLPLALLLAAPAASAQFVLSNFTDGGGGDDAEITPDGRYGVVRENSGSSMAVRLLDMANGAQLQSLTFNGLNGACQDAVAVTDTRAIVIGNFAVVLDLTNPTNPLLAQQSVGFFPRDVTITPDGSLAAVRGGGGPLGQSGLYVFDLATGAQLLNAPGKPSDVPLFSFDVDSVVADDTHAVFLSKVDLGLTDRARVTVVELRPAGGGPPAVVFETSLAGPAFDQAGAPHDLALTPDGQHVAVRSELSVALYALNGAATQQLWHKRLFGAPGPFVGSAMDSVEVTDDRVATISRWSNGGIGAQLDVFDLAGTQKYDRFDGDPHDLAITPDGTRVLVRTSARLLLYDLVNLPPGDQLTPLESAAVGSSHTSFGAGLDSLVVSDTRAVSLHRQGTDSDVRLWSLGPDTLAQTALIGLPDKPCDVALSPSGELAAVAGTEHVLVIDLRTDQVLVDHEPVVGTQLFPWCDGVVLDDERGLFFGYTSDVFGLTGWITVVDLFAEPQTYCTAATNSTGAGAPIHATGSAGIAANDLELWGTSLPPGVAAAFVYADGTAATPFGDGFLCVGGTQFRFPPTVASAGGVAGQMVDYTGGPGLGGAITAGTSWNFQLWYRDPASAGAGFNASDGLSIAFLP